jgi:small subunit ribosomal protein S16
MKQFGRKHRPYYRICVLDIRKPRDGRVLEEVGTYDPMIPETDARAILNSERIAYWKSVGAKPSEAVAVLIKKYGENGTHIAAQQAAVERLAVARRRPEPTPIAPRPSKQSKAAKAEAVAEAPAAEPAAAPEA